MALKFLFPFMASFLMMSVFTNVTSAEDLHTHTTAESMARSGYEFLWDSIQAEYDKIEFENEADQKKYFRLVDIMIRTGSVYAQPLEFTRTGIAELYPKLLEIHDAPPLYVQYRYHSSQAQHNLDIPSSKFQYHAEALYEIGFSMEVQSYPDYIIGAVLLRSAEFFRNAGLEFNEQAIKANHTGIETLVRAARLDGIHAEHQEFVAIRISRHGWRYTALTEDNKDQFNKRLLEEEDVDTWLAHYTHGMRNRNLAWNSRGSEFAGKVTDEQWRLFKMYMGISNSHLIKAWESRPQWPDAAVEMIANVMGNGVPDGTDYDETFWFNEAVSARIDHQDAYAKYIYAYTPRWGGSIESMANFTEYVISLSDEVDNLTYILLNCVGTLTLELDGANAIELTNEMCPILTRLAYEEISDPLPYKNTWQQARMLRTIALINYKSQEYEHASRLLKAGGMKVDKFVNLWSQHNAFTIYARMLSSPLSDSMIKALHALDGDDPKSAAQYYREMKETLEDESVEIDPILNRWQMIYDVEDDLYDIEN